MRRTEFSRIIKVIGIIALRLELRSLSVLHANHLLLNPVYFQIVVNVLLASAVFLSTSKDHRGLGVFLRDSFLRGAQFHLQYRAKVHQEVQKLMALPIISPNKPNFDLTPFLE